MTKTGMIEALGVIVVILIVIGLIVGVVIGSLFVLGQVLGTIFSLSVGIIAMYFYAAWILSE